jgi:hypothetical protein
MTLEVMEVVTRYGGRERLSDHVIDSERNSTGPLKRIVGHFHDMNLVNRRIRS